MVIPTVTPLGSESTAHPERAQCDHTRHMGTCPACQRAAKKRSEAQLVAAMAARATWAKHGLRRPVLTIRPDDNQLAIPVRDCK